MEGDTEREEFYSKESDGWIILTQWRLNDNLKEEPC